MEEPLIPAPRFKYSLSWAASIVDEVVSKYPRASDLVCQVYGISRYDLVKYLAKPDPLWNYLRERIKALAGLEERTGKPVNYETVVKWLEDLHHSKHAHSQGERLDNRRKALKIEEQGSRGGGGRSKAKAEPSLPSLPPSSPDPRQFLFDFLLEA